MAALGLQPTEEVSSLLGSTHKNEVRAEAAVSDNRRARWNGVLVYALTFCRAFIFSRHAFLR
jgi:hypothetical protein